MKYENKPSAKSSWITWLLLVIMPVLLISFFGVMMAESQVKGQFAEYENVAEYTSLSSLTTVNDKIVMVRGQLADMPTFDNPDGLIVYQERPLDGREMRYGEEFPLNFPTILLQLTDGTIVVEPSMGDENVIAHEIHRVTPAGDDREYTGFRAGDVVTVQGVWVPSETSEQPVLAEVTGITSLDRTAYLAEWQAGFDQLALVRNIMGLLTVLSVVLFIVQLRRFRKGNKPQDGVGGTKSEFSYG